MESEPNHIGRHKKIRKIPEFIEIAHHAAIHCDQDDVLTKRKQIIIT